MHINVSKEARHSRGYATSFYGKVNAIGFGEAYLNSDQTSESRFEAIIAHEVSHLKHYDYTKWHILQSILTAIAMSLACVLTFNIIHSVNEELSLLTVSLFHWLAAIIAMPIFESMATLVLNFRQRRIEYRADQESALLVGPSKIIELLEDIELADAKLNQDAPVIQNKFQQIIMKFITKCLELISTHPCNQDRIKAIKNLNILKNNMVSSS